jgi:hypothetical protein
MKSDSVGLTSELILLLIKEHQHNSKQGYIDVILENVDDCCSGPEARLQLQIAYDGKRFSQIVSGCLSPEETKHIRDLIEGYCKHGVMTTHH